MKKYSMETIVGIFVVIGIICLGYMTIKLGDVHLLAGSDNTFYARFASVSGLRVGSPVEVYGLEVGSVEQMKIDQKLQMAVVQMRLRKNVEIFRDSSAAIKTAGLIGDKYVQIDPGGAEDPLEPGGWIIQTSSPMDLEDIIGKIAFGNVKENE